jgi:hypothetical protein
MQETQVIERQRIALSACVLYVGGSFGYRRVECRSLTITPGRYAQHDQALHVEYLEKGKRRARAFVCYAFGAQAETDAPGSRTNTPFVVLEAGAHVDAPATFDSLGDGSAITRHLSCSPAWDREFHAALTKCGASVLFDGRKGGR